MKKITPLLIFTTLVLVAVAFTSRAVQTRGLQGKPAPAPAKGFTIRQDAKAGTIAVFRAGGRTALVTQNARPDERPYLHPLVAPDGRGILTEDKPAHHPHQTGLYWGFTRVNGRDYFHNPGGNSGGVSRQLCCRRLARKCAGRRCTTCSTKVARRC